MAEAISVQYPRATIDQFDKNVRRFVRSAVTGITSSYTTAITTVAGEVALIDKIVMRAQTNDAATNTTITFEVNGTGNDIPFHFPGVLDNRRQDQIILEPRGNWVIQPSQTLKVKASANNIATCNIYYRRMSLVKALEEKLIPTTLPNVASTNTASGGGTAANTAKIIVTGVAGYQIEVLGFYFTGHNYNAATDRTILGFWEGTGTFYTAPATKAATAWPIHVVHVGGANVTFAPRVIVNDTQGCIQGPAGYSLYIQSTANLAGATPTGDFVVMYRMVKAERQLHRTTVALTAAGETAIVVARTIPPTTPASGTLQIVRNDGTQTGIVYSSYTGSTFTITSTAFNGSGATDDADVGSLVWTDDHMEINDPRGALGQNLVRRKKFWCNTIAAATTFVDGSESANIIFEAYDAQDTDVVIKMKGHVASYITQRAAAPFNATGMPAGVILGGGAASGVAFFGNISLNDANPDGADVDTSRQVVEGDELVTCNFSQSPSFLAYQGAAGDIAARSQTVWGTFSSNRDTTGFASFLA